MAANPIALRMRIVPFRKPDLLPGAAAPRPAPLPPPWGAALTLHTACLAALAAAQMAAVAPVLVGG